MSKKELSPSAAVSAKCLFAAMQYLKSIDKGAPVREITKHLEETLTFTEWEKARAGKYDTVRWVTNYQFYSVDYCKAGFIEKSDGLWYLTVKGEEALKRSPVEVMLEANEAYSQWKKAQPKTEKVVEEVAPEDSAPSFEDLQSQALSEIKEYIQSMDPYAFQDLVAALLRAMGYYTPFVASKGKDGGCDIVAYSDPLGLKEPRIKVQVKRYSDTTMVGADAVRSLLGILSPGSGEVALFVTSGSYTNDAYSAAKGRNIKLIDGNELITLWKEFYSRMNDDDKDRLPLRYIAFLNKQD